MPVVGYTFPTSFSIMESETATYLLSQLSLHLGSHVTYFWSKKYKGKSTWCFGKGITHPSFTIKTKEKSMKAEFYSS